RCVPAAAARRPAATHRGPRAGHCGRAASECVCVCMCRGACPLRPRGARLLRTAAHVRDTADVLPVSACACVCVERCVPAAAARRPAATHRGPRAGHCGRAASECVCVCMCRGACPLRPRGARLLRTAAHVRDTADVLPVSACACVCVEVRARCGRAAPGCYAPRPTCGTLRTCCQCVPAAAARRPAATHRGPRAGHCGRAASECVCVCMCRGACPLRPRGARLLRTAAHVRDTADVLPVSACACVCVEVRARCGRAAPGCYAPRPTCGTLRTCCQCVPAAAARRPAATHRGPRAGHCGRAASECVCVCMCRGACPLRPRGARLLRTAAHVRDTADVLPVSACACVCVERCVPAAAARRPAATHRGPRAGHCGRAASECVCVCMCRGACPLRPRGARLLRTAAHVRDTADVLPVSACACVCVERCVPAAAARRPAATHRGPRAGHCGRAASECVCVCMCRGACPLRPRGARLLRTAAHVRDTADVLPVSACACVCVEVRARCGRAAPGCYAPRPTCGTLRTCCQ
ncbi:hypothetical protein ACJJTC_011312, partial [Scirpophaga incertulas]